MVVLESGQQYNIGKKPAVIEPILHVLLHTIAMQVIHQNRGKSPR